MKKLFFRAGKFQSVDLNEIWSDLRQSLGDEFSEELKDMLAFGQSRIICSCAAFIAVLEASSISPEAPHAYDSDAATL